MVLGISGGHRAMIAFLLSILILAGCGGADDSTPGEIAVSSRAVIESDDTTRADEPGVTEGDSEAPEWNDVIGSDTVNSAPDTPARSDAEPPADVPSPAEPTSGSLTTVGPRPPADVPAPEEPTSSTASPRPEITATYFETLPPGSTLPSDASCAQAVASMPLPETHPENAQANQVAGGPAVRIDGADEQYNDVLAPRITGNFTGTTEELIRWVACKWGFDEDLTRARAWTESSWSIRTEGDQTDFVPACDYLGLASPCFQSYGLLQVKGTVHDGTYPFAHGSTAWGLDYAMAWQRACYEGAFSWLVEDGYAAGDVNGCVGAWYSGEWFDDLAVGYLADVGWNLDNRPWE